MTIATVLKSMGYATGQFGKNHLGDKNEFLPCVHGFDEFFGYLYHLDAMEDPAHPNYPQNLLNVVGPRNMVHCWATDKDDSTDMPRWGKSASKRSRMLARSIPNGWKPWTTRSSTSPSSSSTRPRSDNKPFFVWLNPTRMHIVTHLSPEYEALRNAENGWSDEEAGMAQLDDDRRLGHEEAEGQWARTNTIVVFTTDNGTENFTWPDGGQTPFAQSKGTVLEGGFRVPAILRWPGHVPAGLRAERHFLWHGLASRPSWRPPAIRISPKNC